MGDVPGDRSAVLERQGAKLMLAASVALTWMVLTTASVMGLSALARAAAASETEVDLASLTLEDELRARSAYVSDARHMALTRRR